MLEVILALAVFSIAATGFIVAIRKMGMVAQLAQSEMRITRIMESALSEAVSRPTMEEGTTSLNLVESDTEVITKIESMQDQLQNQDGQVLQEMYLITVTAHWIENNEQQERTARTWRYSRMYQP
ncbi:hypothetical protein KBB96_04755 [Luteolibacter ambystomatis]|uniref:Type II secretion system protein n=2 Tax=Luteolibacter ambystomatis TaxID=2824561 RepID=A0A975J1B2_9BACT|nr:hypothetical protein [Luteolibacter ambystomatis]QUE52203.1 hypothetical protein KBB96_04755 [Luteolibacter ambystomatis]